MGRRRLILWGALSLVFVVMISPIALWLAARWWPQAVGPWLPLRIAVEIATWGEWEDSAAVCSLYAYDSDQPGRREYAVKVLAQQLQKRQEHQRVVLSWLDRAEFGPSPFFVGECREQVYRLTQSLDPKIRETARRIWLGFRPYNDFLKRVFDGNAKWQGVAAPDGWIPGEAGAQALALLVMVHKGYDHVLPTYYRQFARDRIQRLITMTLPDGRFSDDLRTQSLCLAAVAELYAVSGDADLLPVVRRASAQWQEPAFREQLSTLWVHDTTTAYLVTNCGRTLLKVADVLGVTECMEALQAGFASWVASGSESQPPAWRQHGQDLNVPDGERWAVMLVGAELMDRRDLFPNQPPAALIEMTSWSPLGGYLSALALSHGHRGGPEMRSAWRDACLRRNDEVWESQALTPDRLGVQGGWRAHPPYGDEWESLFAVLQFNFRFGK